MWSYIFNIFVVIDILPNIYVIFYHNNQLSFTFATYCYFLSSCHLSQLFNGILKFRNMCIIYIIAPTIFLFVVLLIFTPIPFHIKYVKILLMLLDTTHLVLQKRGYVQFVLMFVWIAHVFFTCFFHFLHRLLFI
jgi:hypothetical protein